MLKALDPIRPSGRWSGGVAPPEGVGGGAPPPCQNEIRYQSAGFAAIDCGLEAKRASGHDGLMLRTIHLSLLTALLWPLCSRGETMSEALARATAAVQAATPRAQADPAHPIFHVTSPAQWVNDPNGPIFY